MENAVVHKHRVTPLGVGSVRLPVRHEIVGFGTQEGTFYLWEMHTDQPDNLTAMFDFIIVGTGHPTPDGYYVMGHRGICLDGIFGWHLIELAKKS